jgi:hypothetical protein
MANGKIMENIQRFYRIVSLGLTVFYVAVVLVPFTVVLVRQLGVQNSGCEPSSNGGGASSAARAAMANE